MADRAPVTIRLGGRLTRAGLDELAEVIDADRAYLEDDGQPFDPAAIEPGVLRLVADEVAWGRLDRIEHFCVAQGLAFARWSGAAPGAFGPERVVFDGSGEPRSYVVTDEDEMVASLPTLRQLGSMIAIESWFAAGDFEPPPLDIVD